MELGLHQKVAGMYPGLDTVTIHPHDMDEPVGGLATLADGTLVVPFSTPARSRRHDRNPNPTVSCGYSAIRTGHRRKSRAN